MTIKCIQCGKENEDGTVYCDDCGAQLIQVEPTILAAEEPASTAAPDVEKESAEPVLQGNAGGVSLTPPATAKLVVTRGAKLGIEYPLTIGENEIGRWDDEAGSTPHIDLTDQDAEGFVHRRHAMIRFDGCQWWLEHLKEPPSNPTRIRGRGERLAVGQPVPLQNGDEIVVGRVILKFVIE